MAFIEWKDSLNLNVESIDKEHMNLVLLANTLIDSAKNKNTNITKKTFHELREYTIYHFNNEEAYMKQIAYPKIKEHEKQHELLKKQVKQFQEDHYHHLEIQSETIVNFMKQWLIDHIIYCDLEIKKYNEAQKGTQKTPNENGHINEAK
jgi:hemerythrin-like metal-binding protein